MTNSVQKINFCCEEMAFFVAENEIGIVYSEKFREYGLMYRDGGSSKQLIKFCPWCGSKLPEPLGNEWFNRLEAAGIDPLDKKNIPSSFNSSEWWKNDPKLSKKQ